MISLNIRRGGSAGGGVGDGVSVVDDVAEGDQVEVGASVADGTGVEVGGGA
jgi:hypothetical protein